jgi:hypothetical protein
MRARLFIGMKNFNNKFSNLRTIQLLIYVFLFITISIANPGLTERWVFKTKVEFPTTPLIINGNIVFGNQNGFIYSLNADNGVKFWSISLGKNKFGSVPISLNDSSFFIKDKSGEIYCINPDNGSVLWGNKTGYSRDNIFKGDCEISAGDGLVFSIADNNTIIAIDGKTGQKKWEFKSSDDDLTSPYYLNGTVYFGDGLGMVLGLKSSDGSEKWRFSLGNSSKIIGEICANDSLIFFGTERNGFVCVRIKDKAVLWRGNNGASGVISDNTIFCGGFGYDISSGILTQEYPVSIAYIPDFTSPNTRKSTALNGLLAGFNHVRPSTFKHEVHLNVCKIGTNEVIFNKITDYGWIIPQGAPLLTDSMLYAPFKESFVAYNLPPTIVSKVVKVDNKPINTTDTNAIASPTVANTAEQPNPIIDRQAHKQVDKISRPSTEISDVWRIDWMATGSRFFTAKEDTFPITYPPKPFAEAIFWWSNEWKDFEPSNLFRINAAKGTAFIAGQTKYIEGIKLSSAGIATPKDTLTGIFKTHKNAEIKYSEFVALAKADRVLFPIEQILGWGGLATFIFCGLEKSPIHNDGIALTGLGMMGIDAVVVIPVQKFVHAKSYKSLLEAVFLFNGEEMGKKR